MGRCSSSRNYGGNVVPATTGGLGLQTFTDLTTGAAAVGVILANIDTANNAIVLPNSQLSNGQSVTYNSLQADGNNTIGNLDVSYTVQFLAGSTS